MNALRSSGLLLVIALSGAACQTRPPVVTPSSPNVRPSPPPATPSAPATGAPASIRSHSIRPSDTDPAIDVANDPHVALLGTCTARRGQLFLYLPGTGGKPLAGMPVARRAAEQCFHVLSLSYPNQTSVINDCVRQGPDPDCYAAWRMEKLDGVDRSAKIAVNRANSIENRLVKALRYLATKYPGDGWQSYVDRDGVRWERVVVGGMSQGGGEAAMIAKVHLVARVVMLASVTDAVGTLQGPAPAWESTPGATPADRYYGFANAKDAFWTGEQHGWTALGLDPFGPIVDVDHEPSPYGSSHRLSTDVACSDPTLSNCAHTTVESPRFRLVWDYMLGEVPSPR